MANVTDRLRMRFPMQARIASVGATVWIPMLAILLAAFPESAIALPSPLQCFANGGVPTPARVEGLSESVGDVVLNCIGGTPTAAGSANPLVNIPVFLTTALTSRILS